MSANQTIVNILDTIALVMVKIFGANWRTTVFGLLVNVGVIVSGFIIMPDFKLKTHLPLIVLAIVNFIKSTYEKDKSVTGGVNKNTVTKSGNSVTKEGSTGTEVDGNSIKPDNDTPNA